MVQGLQGNQFLKMEKYLVAMTWKIICQTSWLGFPGKENKIKEMKFSKIASFYEKHTDAKEKLKYLEDNFTYVELDDLKKL